MMSRARIGKYDQKARGALDKVEGRLGLGTVWFELIVMFGKLKVGV
jgi:hypothetical protein